MNFLINSKITTIVLAGFLIFIGAGLIKLHDQRAVVSGDVRDLERKKSEVKKSNDYLEKLSDSFKSPAFLERQARAKLNYKYPDEEVVFVYKESDSPRKETASSSADFEKWFQKLPNFIKKILKIK